eukprot:CAMPEP_0178907736 /NCGR_PEP_ID=MMETSP0786-20121207/7536_1 /TAXON_ID=186022 /ORGANISM="Thalassionema frauenfeldii, Strain CCMP 1798" /LENGTH=295 /DNA_ID=CAMNT_0020579567 /DNA_START=443 /DNA_END=1331 /DNA_ORIENTATION=-
MAKTPVPRYPQLILNEGDTQLTVEVVLTAHHKGHFEFKACPYKEKGEKIAQSCFDDYPLLVVSDDFYGMSPDPDFPERAYIPSLSQWNLQSEGSGGSLYRYTLQLPKDLPSGNILLQWHYLTANTCIYSGYDSYAFPSDWGNMGYKGKPYCQMPLSLDGLGLPEQFWNCAEIYMEGNNDEGGDDVDNSSSDSIDENNNSQVFPIVAMAELTMEFVPTIRIAVHLMGIVEEVLNIVLRVGIQCYKHPRPTIIVGVAIFVLASVVILTIAAPLMDTVAVPLHIVKVPPTIILRGPID